MSVLLAGVVGSTAYGLAHAGSDVDRLGIFATDTLTLLDLHRPPETRVTTSPDATYHEAGKWCRLALGCNPTAMELAWLSEYEVQTELGTELLTIRGAFLSAAMVRGSYLGYATQQLKKIKTRDPASRLRSEKHARHLVRLLQQGTVLHLTGQLVITLEDPTLVRDLGQLVAADPMVGDQLLRDAETQFNRPGALPALPDERAVWTWLRHVRQAFYHEDHQ